MSISKKYLEQYRRVKRYYQRFKDINDGKQHNLPSDYYEDDVYSFFVNCYHLKDWIKNDQSNIVMDIDVEEYINDNMALCICGDICNGIKHLKLDENRKPRSEENPKFDGKKHKLELGKANPVYSCKYIIKTNSGERSAFDLATECVELWKHYIENNISDRISS